MIGRLLDGEDRLNPALRQVEDLHRRVQEAYLAGSLDIDLRHHGPRIVFPHLGGGEHIEGVKRFLVHPGIPHAHSAQRRAQTITPSLSSATLHPMIVDCRSLNVVTCGQACHGSVAVVDVDVDLFVAIPDAASA
ncbi:hypothetical protein L596_000672 [Steinernema carpocapsae]|uniref:Uncharacterized protein n=1 Tax=Steinernema carpocapsae TaxID=34508 RepID=A0A4U8UN06_STECR|nr:hypothetical protein L596_000672 [Steinernema carpocapsae]